MNTIEEIWRDIEGFEGLYQASNLGNVKSIRKRERKLKPAKTRGGYLFVNLSKNGKTKEIRLNRLIAQTFPDICGEINDKKEVHHKNHNVEDNRADNLVCLTKEEHSKEHPEWGDMASIVTSKPVAQYTYSGEFVKLYPNSIEASKAIGVALSAIRNVTCGLSHSSGGYRWVQTSEPDMFIEPVLSPEEKSHLNGNKVIIKYSLDMKPICEYNSIRIAGKENGIIPTAIGNCLKGRTQTSGGFKWAYKS